MSRLIVPIAFALITLASSAEAQTSTPTSDSASASAVPSAGDPIPRPANDSLFRRARRLVSEGNGVAGRALVDSLLAAADPAMPAYGDALYWHGALAPTAAAAEADYRRVIVEYPLAYYSGDALLAIAELEQARGDRAGAIQHLQRFVREHPDNPGRGIAALGAARLAFEQRDSTLACSMLAEARRSVSASDVELQNQITYYGNRCVPSPGTTVVSAPPAATSAAASTAASSQASAPKTTPAAAPTTAPTTAATTAPTRPSPAIARASAPVPTRAAAREPVREPAREAARVPARTPTPQPAKPTAKTTDRKTTDRKTPDRKTTDRKTPAPTRADAPARSATDYTVQVAAYETRADAQALVKKLAARGVKARVSGTSKPFRVRLGLHSTRKDAIAELTALQKRGIDGFVAEETTSAGARTP